MMTHGQMLALRAPVQGTVIGIEVQAGQQVLAGAPLLLLESMKMEVPLPAPGAACTYSACAE